MRSIKILLSILFVAAILIVVALNFSTVESRYECTGEMTQDQKSVPGSVYIKVERYRWWVHLWAKSDARLWLEIPNVGGDVHNKVQLSGDHFLIMPDGDESAGDFSTLSKALFITTSRGIFSGMCKKADA